MSVISLHLQLHLDLKQKEGHHSPLVHPLALVGHFIVMMPLLSERLHHLLILMTTHLLHQHHSWLVKISLLFLFLGLLQ